MGVLFELVHFFYIYEDHIPDNVVEFGDGLQWPIA